jgi:hypothetical protein
VSSIQKENGQVMTHVDLGQEEIVELSEVDKRLMLYRNMRAKLLQELEKNKQADDRAKMEELNRKIAALEKASREKDEEERKKQRQE